MNNKHQKYLEDPYQMDQDESEQMIAIPLGLGVEYISVSDAKDELEMNKKLIKKYEMQEKAEIANSDESEEPHIIAKFAKEISELEETNQILEKALSEQEFGETLESTLDPKSSEYDPEFAKIYEKQQKGLKEIESQPKQSNDDDLDIEEGGEETDLSKFKRVALKPNSPSSKPYQFDEESDEEDLMMTLKEFDQQLKILGEIPGAGNKIKTLGEFILDILKEHNIPLSLVSSQFPYIKDSLIYYVKPKEKKEPSLQKYKGFSEDYAEIEYLDKPDPDAKEEMKRAKESEQRSFDIKQKQKINVFLERIDEMLKQKKLLPERKKELQEKKSLLEDKLEKIEESLLKFGEECK